MFERSLYDCQFRSAIAFDLPRTDEERNFLMRCSRRYDCKGVIIYLAMGNDEEGARWIQELQLDEFPNDAISIIDFL